MSEMIFGKLGRKLERKSYFCTMNSEQQNEALISNFLSFDFDDLLLHFPSFEIWRKN